MKFYNIFVITIVAIFLSACTTSSDSQNSSDPQNPKTDPVVYTRPNIQPLVVIRINFKNQTFVHNARTWSNKIFGTNEGQLNHYFNEVSAGDFQFSKAYETDGDNDGVITITLNENHPNTESNGLAFISRLKAALSAADPYINFADYDTNNNNAISKNELQIMFLVAGAETSYGGNGVGGIWAHSWCLSSRVNAAAPNHDGVSLLNCLLGGNYSRFGERHKNHDATIGVIAHELGHSALYLIDLYDIDSDNGMSAGIGEFGLMGTGAWTTSGALAQNNETLPGDRPTHLIAWSKIKSHFVQPTIVTDAGTKIVYGTGDNNYQTYQVNTGVSGEYFLIENRANRGYDRGLSALDGTFKGGILITHIDDNQNTNGDENHKLVDVEEAHNPTLDLDYGNKGRVDNLFQKDDEFTPTSTPNSNTYNDDNTGISITNIGSPGNSIGVTISP